jgi:mRNA-degrading endonuclease RelE of RelBE toxin-antitoxin system
LAALWLAAADREEVTAASYRIEERIRHNPLGAGESRDHDDERVLIDPPLRVFYLVDEPNRTVHVTSVGPSRRPR